MTQREQTDEMVLEAALRAELNKVTESMTPAQFENFIASQPKDVQKVMTEVLWK